MYKVVKTGLTACNRIFVENETFTDEQAASIGLDVWFDEFKGRTWAGLYIVKDGEGETGSESNDNGSGDTNVDPAVAIITKKGFTVDAVMKMTPGERNKAFGPKNGKVVKEYVESNTPQ